MPRVCFRAAYLKILVMNAALGRIDLDPDHGEGDAARWYVTDDNSLPYSPERDRLIPDGTVVPGVIISGQYSGDRADVRCAARWAAGRWALEIVRRLQTGSRYDVPIKTGHFMRVAAFDHGQYQTYTAGSADISGGGVVSQVCKVTINGDVVAANPGDLLLDAALMNGIELPHDCRSGYCGTCRVRVLAGRCLGGASDISNVVHACQTRVISDLTVVLEKVPEIVQVSGEIAGLVNVAPDVVV